MKLFSGKKLSLFVLICSIMCCMFASVCLAVSAPGQVESLKAKPTYNNVTLSWSKLKDCDSYAVFYYSPTTEKYTFIKNVSNNECKVTGLDEGETYYFAVQGFNTDEDNKLYGTISEYVKTTTKVEQLDKVKDLEYSSLTNNKVKLSWSKVNGAKYAVYFYDADTKKYTLISNTNSTSLTVKDLDAETAYRFTVRPFKKAGGKTYYGDYSAKLKVTTPTPTLSAKEARKLYNNAIDVYMNWVYSCSYTSTDYINRNFYGLMCRFAAVNHPDIKSKSDLEDMLSKYFTKEVYENELYFYIEVGGKLYHYAEGGASEPDKGTKHYTDSLKKVNTKNYKYTLLPTYYPKFENENNPKSFIFSIVRKDGRWLFDTKFYTCCAKIKD